MTVRVEIAGVERVEEEVVVEEEESKGRRKSRDKGYQRQTKTAVSCLLVGATAVDGQLIVELLGGGEIFSLVWWAEEKSPSELGVFTAPSRPPERRETETHGSRWQTGLVQNSREIKKKRMGWDTVEEQKGTEREREGFRSRLVATREGLGEAHLEGR